MKYVKINSEYLNEDQIKGMLVKKLLPNFKLIKVEIKKGTNENNIQLHCKNIGPSISLEDFVNVTEKIKSEFKNAYNFLIIKGNVSNPVFSFNL